MAEDTNVWGFNKNDATQLLTVIGGEDVAYRENEPIYDGGSNVGIKLFQTPGGGIAARSGTTVSSATCTEFKLVSGTLTTNTMTATVYNPWPVAIPASYYITAVKESISKFWIVQFPGVIDVQWDSPDLEQTLDGTTYNNIDTAVDCP